MSQVKSISRRPGASARLFPAVWLQAIRVVRESAPRVVGERSSVAFRSVNPVSCFSTWNGVDCRHRKSGADPPVPIGYGDHALQLRLRVRIRRALHEYVDERNMRSRHALTVSLAVGQPCRGFIALGLGPDEGCGRGSDSPTIADRKRIAVAASPDRQANA
jgi:hypothetical protein